jgi:hypothetical protein
MRLNEVHPALEAVHPFTAPVQVARAAEYVLRLQRSDRRRDAEKKTTHRAAHECCDYPSGFTS